MPLTNGACTLWVSYAQPIAELEDHYKNRPIVSRKDAEVLLQSRGLLAKPKQKQAGAASAGRTANKPSTGKSAPDAQQTITSTPRGMEEQTQAPACTIASAHPEDVPMLDCNRIEIKWPQTRAGETRFLTRVGTVRYLPQQERRRPETVYLIEFERKPTTAWKGLRTRKSSWKKLGKRKFNVLEGVLPEKAPRARWSEDEEEAVRVRRGAGETYGSIGKALGRTEGAIDRCFKKFKDKYKQTKGRQGLRSGVTASLVGRAMCTMDGRAGTSVEVYRAVLELATKENIPLDMSVQPYELNVTRTQQSVKAILSRFTNSTFVRTDERRHTPGLDGSDGRLALIYKYNPLEVQEHTRRLSTPLDYVNHQTPNVGGSKLSRKRKQEILAGGDCRHGKR
jgi:hypothetical protein